MHSLNLIKKFLPNNSGNVMLTFAISIIPILLSIGVAVDYSRASNLRTKLTHATDSALLAATAAVMKDVDLEDYDAVLAKLNQEFEPFFLANMHNVNGYNFAGYTISYNQATKAVSVILNVDYDTAILRVIGKDVLELNITAVTGMQIKGGGALSMFLVLDRSGSMAWSNGEGGTKMQSLKLAVNDMITNFQQIDPNNNYIRIGAAAYSSHMWSVQPIKWNLNKANDYVQAMYADGGTDSSGAINKAYVKLKKPSELSKHFNKNGQVPELVMVFMTDGNNNDPSDDTATINKCNQAKAYGMKVYTVAFQAPANGQTLLSNCASDQDYYFEVSNTAELIEAFKNIGASTSEKLHLSY